MTQIELLAFINSLPEEKTSEELEKAAIEYANKDENYAWWLVNDEVGNDDIMLIRKAFKTGAKWQKEQILKKVWENIEEATRYLEQSNDDEEMLLGIYWDGAHDALVALERELTSEKMED